MTTHDCAMKASDTLTIQSELVADGHDLVVRPSDAAFHLLLLIT